MSQVSSALNTSGIIAYHTGDIVPESAMSPLDPAAFGGEILDAGVAWSGRIDLLESGFIGGVFQATRGRYRVVYPGSVHATIHVGEVIARSLGNTYRLGPGATFFVTKGTEVEFETVGPMHQASFMGNFGSPDGAPRFTVIQMGQAVPDEELNSLGSIEDFNGQVLSGDPQVYGLFDYQAGAEFGGAYQVTAGKVIVQGTHATEHAVVTRHGMTFTDANGALLKLNQGDAFIQRKGTVLPWEIGRPNVQVHFFASK